MFKKSVLRLARNASSTSVTSQKQMQALYIMVATSVSTAFLLSYSMSIPIEIPTLADVALVLLYGFMEYLLLRFLPGPSVHGPETLAGRKPLYRDNGPLAFYVSLVATSVLTYLFPQYVAQRIIGRMPAISLVLNALALSLCTVLYLLGRNHKKDADMGSTGHGMLFDFYWGLNLHPRIAGVDVKQFTNCRFGMMAWPLVSVMCLAYQMVQGGGVGPALIVSVALQLVYVCKFFRWEKGYFATTDMQHDRAGYYLCWGCLVWVPCFYTLPSLAIAAIPQGADAYSTANTVFCALWLVVGTFSIFFNYQADLQKMKVRSTGGECTIWGRKPRVIHAPYVVEHPDGKVSKRSSLLLCSGWWGFARHAHYMFELLAAFSWAVTGGLANGAWPYLYFFFLTVLLLHRVFRDEERCAKKYGDKWAEYCRAVPYRMIRYVW